MSFLARMLTPSKSDHTSGAQENALLNSMMTTNTTVDPGTTSNVNNLGRAALISTSPQGIQGIDPTLRYKLLGN